MQNSTQHTNERLDAALYYAELGYPVFPCVPDAKKPLTKHGFHNASLDEDLIRKWWHDNPGANIGVPTAGLLVVDIDGADNSWPDNVDKQLALSDTVSAISVTPRGGRHLIFRQPAGKSWRNTTSKIAPRVDTRAEGGYIIVPPSNVKTTKYRWADTLALDSSAEDLSEPPQWLTTLLDEVEQGKGKAQPHEPQKGGVAIPENDIPEGQRDSSLASLAGNMRRVGMGPAEIYAAITQTNERRCKPSLPDTEVQRIVRSICRYEPDQVSVAVAESHFEQDQAVTPKTTSSKNPGLTPERLLHIPGFVGDVMAFCMETAPYENRIMAFAGALSLQAFLSGRKITDPEHNRTNLYLLGLAHSGSGKEWPRKINSEILNRVGAGDAIGERFASGEGLEDALHLNESMLFQTDELESLILQINSKDIRYESILNSLLKMYSASNSTFNMRRKAGEEGGRTIDQPNLTIFGTAIPNHYYGSLSERMLTNGFFARTIVLENTLRSAGKDAGDFKRIPQTILSVARWWVDYRPGRGGNMADIHPEPRMIPRTDGANKLLAEVRAFCDAEYSKADKDADAVATTVWSRAGEHIRKLSLCYAASVDHENPEITEEGAQWAVEFTLHQVRRMLFMANKHVAPSPFAQAAKRVREKIEKTPEKKMTHSDLLRRMHMDAREFQRIIDTMLISGEISLSENADGKRRKKIYSVG